MENRTEALMAEIRRKLHVGLRDTVDLAAIRLREKLGVPYATEGASEPGEYPHRRSGQGQRNTLGEVDQAGDAAAFGFSGSEFGFGGDVVFEAVSTSEQPTRPGALHLFDLTQGISSTGEFIGERLGPAESFEEDLELLRAAFIKGAS